MSYPSQRIDLAEPPPRLTDEQLAQRWWTAFPEALGPAEEHESGRSIYGQPTRANVGPIPHPSGFGPEQRDKENHERHMRWLAMSDGERALAEAEWLRGQRGR